MQSASSRIWTHVDLSISYNDNHYTTNASLFYVNGNAVRIDKLPKKPAARSSKSHPVR